VLSYLRGSLKDRFHAEIAGVRRENQQPISRGDFKGLDLCLELKLKAMAYLVLRATIRSAPLFFVLLSEATPEAAQRGVLKVNDQCSVALDGGRVECLVTLDGDGTEPKVHPGGKEWDFWFEESGKALFLNPQNRTKFANAGTTEAGKAGCQTAVYKGGRFRIDRLPAGSHVCVLTGHRRYAELTLDSTSMPASGPLPVAYFLWE
jgi:hypothetical protein